MVTLYNPVTDFGELQLWVDSFSPQELMTYGLYFCSAVIAVSALKSVVVFALRFFGLSSPGQYRFFPRLPWRSVLKALFVVHTWRERVFRFGKQSSGGFSSTLGALTNLYSPSKLFLARGYGWGLPLWQPLGAKVTRHVKIFAMSGAGKTTYIIAMIACWKGSVLVIDCKAQVTKALAGKDNKRIWIVIDPYGISGFPSACYNVFDSIKEAVERNGPSAAVLWAQRIALCLINTPAGAKTPYFYDISRGFVTGLILHVLTTHPEDQHNLPYIRYLIVVGYQVINQETGEEETQADETFALLLDTMQNNPAFDGTIAGAAKAVANASGETLGNVLSTLQEQTKWLDVPDVRRILMHSDFSLADLKRRDDMVLALVAPVLSVREELKEFFRLIINMNAYTFESVPEKKGQCLTVVDEMPSLGHNPIFEVALPVARSYGQTYVCISQDTELHRSAYPKTWETFIGNADVVIWMGTNHEATLQYLSGVLGYRSIVEKDPYSGRKSYRQVRVAEADQLRRFLNPDGGRIIITRAGKRALMAVNDPYHNALPVWAYDADPDHKEFLPRRLMRALLGQGRKNPAAADDAVPEPAAESIPEQDQHQHNENEDANNE